MYGIISVSFLGAALCGDIIFMIVISTTGDEAQYESKRTFAVWWKYARFAFLWLFMCLTIGCYCGFDCYNWSLLLKYPDLHLGSPSDPDLLRSDGALSLRLMIDLFNFLLVGVGSVTMVMFLGVALARMSKETNVISNVRKLQYKADDPDGNVELAEVRLRTADSASK